MIELALYLAAASVQKGLDKNGCPDMTTLEGKMLFDEGKTCPKWQAEDKARGIGTPPVRSAPKLQHLEKGWSAFEKGDYATAFQNALLAARAGDSRAFNFVGSMYASGTGTPKDEAKAVFWFKKAAEAKDPNGLAQMSVAHLRGKVVAKDYSEAIRLAKAAVSGGYEPAKTIIRDIENELGVHGFYCANYGFSPPSQGYSQCVFELDSAQRQAAMLQQQYEMQRKLYEQQLATYRAQQEAIEKEKERRKWAAVAAFGFGMAASSSPTFGGSVADGVRAAGGQPPLTTPAPPVPPATSNYTIRFPNGSQMYCHFNSMNGYMSCN